MNDSRFIFSPLAIHGVVSIRQKRIEDSRGSLTRLFCAEELAKAGWTWPIAQINHTHTLRAGSVRGMHYQNMPNVEAKLITCLRGRLWDVAVDLRLGSPTFLHWCALELNAENLTALLIPPGCAHGFQTLTDDVELLYAHSASYKEYAEDGLCPTDPRLGISWPLPISEISDRDVGHPLVTQAFRGLNLPKDLSI